ncbi:MAG: DUF4331 domain-containing protein [Deltaproteobacteria bacterium]|nr:DUF4331 domain-containing protein [Deltaproteobacteria bacterium]
MREKTYRRRAAGMALLLAAVTWLGWTPPDARAADHGEAPGAAADQPADIADYFAWHKEDGGMVVVLSFAGNVTPAAGQTGTYDADVLYGIHFSDSGSAGTPAYGSTHDIWVRFGQNEAGEWGLEVTGLPGEDAPVMGAVGTANTSASGAQFYAGLADDPFFFDLQGFGELVSSGDATSFDSLPGLTSTRDTLAGQNSTVIVLEFPAAMVTSTAGMVHTWATSSRIGS